MCVEHRCTECRSLKCIELSDPFGDCEFRDLIAVYLLNAKTFSRPRTYTQRDTDRHTYKVCIYACADLYGERNYGGRERGIKGEREL